MDTLTLIILISEYYIYIGPMCNKYVALDAKFRTMGHQMLRVKCQSQL